MPNLKVFHAQPSGSMVCGAYAVTAIAIAYGKLPAAGDIALDYASHKAKIKAGDAGLAAAGSVYSITGTGPLGNNMPAAMCYVSQKLGLSPVAQFEKGCSLLSDPTFGGLFGGEQKACATMKAGGAQGTWTPPKKGQAQAVCVDNGGGGFHWLALGEDTNYMDPGDGAIHAWADLSTKTAYAPVGLWITYS